MSRAQQDKLKDRHKEGAPARDSGDMLEHEQTVLPQQEARKQPRLHEGDEKRSGWASDLSPLDAGGQQTRGAYGGLRGILDTVSHRKGGDDGPAASLEQAPLMPGRDAES